ncbi:Olfactory Receptor 52B4 [Manis pentadactyla]|nr:Olfactory Receptor 52B4 [Manis pentadactyla]
MTTLNHTGVSHTVFCLLGIPGLEDQHIWISNPFLISYVIALLGNSLLICIILTKRSLHEPMYLFLCVLAGADIVLSTCTVPQALAIFWFHAGEISLGRCIAQFFIIHCTFIYESGILLVMAFDRYIATCYPLRYTTILMHALIQKIVILHAVFHMPSQDTHHKALNTCGSHGIIILFYGPAIFTILTQWFGSHIPPHIHVLLANVCILVPPILNPIVYGIKTKQIQEQVAHIFFPKQK